MQGARPEQSVSDATLMARIGSGDEHAMAVLYDRCSSVVYSVALRVLGDTSAAEEVLQDVFMQLWRSPHTFDASRGALVAWLAVIARHRSIDRLRRRHPQEDSEEPLIAINANLENEVSRKQAADKVRSLLSAMPQDQRDALELAYFEGLTHSEIANKTSQPLGTVKTRIRSGLLALRKALAA